MHLSAAQTRVRPADVPAMDEDALDGAARMIEQAYCPLLCLGGGIVRAGATGAALQFAQRVGLPIASMPMGLRVVPGDHPLSVGRMGAQASRCTKMALQEADLLVMVGVGLDDRIMAKAAAYARDAETIHVDSAAACPPVPADMALFGDIEGILGELMGRLTLRRRGKWLLRIADLRRALSGLPV